MAIERACFYRRSLPHWQPAETDFFITYRLAGSIPKAQIKALQEAYARLKVLQQKDPALDKFQLTEAYFHNFDNALDKNLNEPWWLQQKESVKRLWTPCFSIIRKPTSYGAHALCPIMFM